MKQLADELRQTVIHEHARLARMSEQKAATRPAHGKWSPQEVLGHLIDSASNNHHRFVRMQLEDGVPPSSYAQESWVAVQHYSSEPWLVTLDLWRSFNLHLAHVIEHVEPDRLEVAAEVGGPQATLRSLMIDYLRHLRHHLQQICTD